MSIAIKRSFTIPSTSAIGASEIYVTSSVASTSAETGALLVSGGVGVSGDISVGGLTKLFNGSYYTGFDSAATANTTYVWPATSPASGTSVLSSDSSGNLSWVLMSASGSGITLNGLTSTTQYFSTVIGGSGFTIGSTGSTHTYYISLAGNASTGLVSSAGQTFFGLKTFASGVAITSGIASTNTTTGDLVVSGGVGIGDSLFVANGIAVNSGTSGLLLRKLVAGNYGAIYSTGVTPSSTNYSMITDGASVNFNGTNGVYFNISNSNKIQVTTNNINIVPTAGSSSTSTGALTVAGGVGIGGSLWTSTLNFSSISGVGFSNNTITSGVWSGTAISTVNGGTGIASYTVGDILYASSSTVLGKIAAGTAGSVLTSAGAGATPYWAASSSSASGMTLNGLTTTTQYFATSISGTGFTIGSTGSTHTYYVALAGNASTGLISGAAQTIFGLKTFASGIAITVGTASTNTTTGSLTVSGGVGITGQLSVNTIALGTTGVSVTPSIVFTGTAGTVITMSVQSDSTLAWEGSSGQLFSIDNNLSSGEIFSVNDISGLPLITASAGQTITLNEFGGYTQVGNGLASTSTTTGALRVIGGLGVTGNVAIGGTITRSAWSVGESINTAMYSYSDLSMAGITTVSGTTYTRIGNVTYTPKSSSSYIWIEFNANYDYSNGTTVDDFWSNITVNGTEIVALNQIFLNASGGGTRSGTIFPIQARYTNSSTSGIAITVQAKRGSADDSIRVYGSSTSGYMRIQEIGR